MKKVLVFYTSVGLGHKTIAENIGWQLQRAGFGVKLADIGQVQHGAFSRIVTAAHQSINKYLPFVWGWIYDWGYYLVLPIRVFIAGFNYKLAKQFVDDYRPDLIITTQTAASGAVAYLKQRGLYKNKFAIAFSDFHLHPFWLYPQADFYLANIEEQKKQMVAKGIAAEKIFVCGMSLKPQLSIDRAAVKNRLAIRPGDKVALIGSGSLGSGLDAGLISQLIGRPNLAVVAVCGKNGTVYRRLQKQFAGSCSVKILGFYEPMDELYAIADIFITKPGGLSASEALRWRLPIIISHLLPGQEQYNYEYLIHQRLILSPSPDVVAAARRELAAGEFKKFLEDSPNPAKIFSTNAAANAISQMV